MIQNSKTAQVNVSNIFMAAGIPSGSVIIEQTEGMYPHKEELTHNWSYFTVAGFKHLYDRKVWPGTVAIVGVGSGVEGIAAEKVFRPRNLIITDVDDEVVSGARRNIKRNLPKRSKLAIMLFVGSFCEPLKSTGLKMDLIHANIPNLPAPKGADLSKGAEKGTFLRPALYEGYNPPHKYIRWALGAQYAYIQSAKEVLAETGSVLTEVGGRVPLSLLNELFTENGFKCREALVGFKEQTEALIDFIGYHEFEKAYGVAFDFYRYERSLLTLKEHCIEGNIAEKMSGDELKELLLPHRVTAGDAIELYHQGIAVGHTVHILQGTKVA